MSASPRAAGGAMSAVDRIAFTIALWFGCGLSPVWPGTVGTLGALPLWLAVRGHGPAAVLAVALVVTVVGIWAAGIVAERRGVSDPQVVVVDEVAGVLVALAAAPPTWPGTVVAVALFRLFDVTKPFPARAAERLHGGAGIVIDDVVAGGYAAAFVVSLRALGWLT